MRFSPKISELGILFVLFPSSQFPLERFHRAPQDSTTCDTSTAGKKKQGLKSGEEFCKKLRGKKLYLCVSLKYVCVFFRECVAAIKKRKH